MTTLIYLWHNLPLFRSSKSFAPAAYAPWVIFKTSEYKTANLSQVDSPVPGPALAACNQQKEEPCWAWHSNVCAGHMAQAELRPTNIVTGNKIRIKLKGLNARKGVQAPGKYTHYGKPRVSSIRGFLQDLT